MTSDDIAAIVARWRAIGSPGAGQLVTRFAPSPTGELHLGHVLHAEWLWGVAAALGARVLIRIEDHDRQRCRPEHERSILDDLAWLGFEPEPDSLASLRSAKSPFRQGDHPERYVAAFETLRDRGALYGCTCTRAMMGPANAAGERRYSGRCRGMPIGRTERTVVRVRLPDHPVEVEDLRHGRVVQRPDRERGDVAVRDAQRQWTYQFCVVVDDLHDGVNLIVRGDDLLPSTGSQVLLARLLGRQTGLVVVHHPLIHDALGRKLSKRDRDETVKSLRRRGLGPADVRRMAVTAATR